MLALFDRPLGELTPADIEELWLKHVPEGQYLEFKSHLPAKGTSVDPWEQGKDEIGDRARNEITEEVIAFANSDGGWVLIGVEESKDHPRRATGATPLRAVAELAPRLEQAI